tara:strand:+ start:1848 stop:1991 length:144 start_codon:yes stop_codon:yes gene_type:complete
MYLNISTPIERKVKIIDSNNNQKTIVTKLSNSDIKRYFDAIEITDIN